ncbi:MAG: hypothetical protein WCL32_21640 [Planctomycetota bacterium]
MAIEPLPKSTDELIEIQSNVQQVSSILDFLLPVLVEIELNPQAPAPIRVTRMQVPDGQATEAVAISTLGIGRAQVNQLLGELSTHLSATIHYLDLDADCKRQVNRAITQRPLDEWYFPTLIEIDGATSTKEERAIDSQRAVSLSMTLKAIQTSCENLTLRLARKLKPPTVRERMKVDQNAGTVTVDGKVFTVRPNEAEALRYLVEANGAPVSGPEIAETLGVSEFRIGRAIKSLVATHPEFGAIITKENSDSNARFRVDLPPLD